MHVNPATQVEVVEATQQHRWAGRARQQERLERPDGEGEYRGQGQRVIKARETQARRPLVLEITDADCGPDGRQWAERNGVVFDFEAGEVEGSAGIVGFKEEGAHGFHVRTVHHEVDDVVVIRNEAVVAEWAEKGWAENHVIYPVLFEATHKVLDDACVHSDLLLVLHFRCTLQRWSSRHEVHKEGK